MSPVPSVRSFFRSSSASLLPPSHPVHRPKPNLAWIPAWIVGPRHDDLRPVRPRRFINARPRHSLLFSPRRRPRETDDDGRRAARSNDETKIRSGRGAVSTGWSRNYRIRETRKTRRSTTSFRTERVAAADFDERWNARGTGAQNL